MNLDPINPEATFRYTGPFICIDGHTFVFGNPVTVKTRSTIEKLMKRDDFILIENKAPEPMKPEPVKVEPVISPKTKPPVVTTKRRKKVDYL